MFGHLCKECHALLAEMHSAITETKAITANAKALRRERNWAGKDIDEWRQITEVWENARRRWILASSELKHHVATHHSTPISTKSVARV
jgi:hypothetical protein